VSKSIYSKFKNPTSDFRGKPFWAWNGKLEKEELMRQIHVIKSMGMGGYFCHSRTGLATQYLGDEWFDLINASADEGEKLGLETWLYDEDRWPSGTAGGMVTENPEYRLKFIRLSIIDKADFVWGNDMIAAFSADIEGFSFKNKKRLYRGDSINGSVLLFTIEEMAKSSFYNGYTYIDTMNKDAVLKFMELTHEKYKEKCGDRLGKTIKGIFTDEPHRGAVMCDGKGALPNENSGFLTPYTEKLFEEFQSAFGYDLVENLPELFLWENGEKFNKVKWQYVELLQRLFTDSYFKPINKWCKENKIKLTGHVLHEDSLAAQTCMIGSVMRAYEHMEYPGVDVLDEKNNCYWIVKQLTSVGRQLNKKKLVSELYGCTGWQMNFENYKAVGDWQALLGINMRCLHLAWYSMQGESKRDYPASILHQSAWYKDYKYVEDYFSRINVFMSQGEPVCDLLVINPVESVWAMIYPNWAYWLDSDDHDIKKIQENYADVFNILMSAKIDFDYGDEEMMSRLCKVVNVNGEVYLKVGNAQYKTVLVSGMLTIRNSTLNILKNFITAGGKVVFAGKEPTYVDAVKSEKSKLEGAVFVPFEENVILKQLKMEDFFSILDANGSNIKDIYAQIRKHGNDYIIFILNKNRVKCFENVTVRIDRNGYLEKWDARSANRTTYGYFEGKAEIKINLPQCGEVLLVLTEKNNNLNGEVNLIDISTQSLPETFRFELSEPNVCVLDFASYKIDDEEWRKETEILKVDRQLRKRFGLSLRGGEMLQPWFAGKRSENALCKVKLEFEFYIDKIPGNIRLAMEQPENFEVNLNGINVQYNTAVDWWVDKSIKIINFDQSLLQPGKNIIVLNCNFKESTNLESIYLIGNFSVYLEGLKKSIGLLPNELTMGDISKQGFPFYGAKITYHIGKAPEVAENELLFIKLDSFDAACVKVSDGEKEKIIAFSPYEADITSFAGKNLELEYILTRRNTFGPLHQYPEIASGYGPNNFITEGANFLYDRYGLLPQSMTGDVVFIKRKKN
jgi:hypothetical protein